MTGTGPARDQRARLRSAAPLLGIVLACFVAGALVQPLWSRAAGGYADILTLASAPLVAWLEPVPVVRSWSRTGTAVEINSDFTPDRSLGTVETRHFSFYLPFIVLLLGVARWRLRIVSGPEMLLILAFLFAVQVCCLSLGALRLVAFALVPGGGFPLIGPLEYDLLHTLYHVYGNFGPELWNGVVVAFVLLRGAPAAGLIAARPVRPAASRSLIAACAIMILPACLYMATAPIVRGFTGEARRARLVVARHQAQAGDVNGAALLLRDLVDADGKDLRALLLLGRLEETARPEQAAAWYERALATDPMDLSALMGLARVRTALADETDAETLYYRALIIAPRHGEAYEGIADLAMARGDYQAARTPYEMAIRFSPGRRGLLLKLAQAHRLAGDPCTARSVYAKSLTLDASAEHQSLVLGLDREIAALCPRAAR